MSTSSPDVMRLLLNASAALDNVRYFIEHHGEGLETSQRSAEVQLWSALSYLKELEPLIGTDPKGSAMIAAELQLCHAKTDPVDGRKLCRLERGHDGGHVDSQTMYERERRERWQSGTIYDFERAEAEAYLLEVSV